MNTAFRSSHATGFVPRPLRGPAAQAASSCSVRRLRRAPRLRAAFSLIEVLVAMAIFAIGFTIIAAAVPAGTLLGRHTENDIVSTIAARNAVSIIEARKVHIHGFEHHYMHDLLSEGSYRSEANNGQCVALNGDFSGVKHDNRPNDEDKIYDYEDSCTSYSSWAGYIDNPHAMYCRGFWGASSSFRAAYDTNGDGYPGDGYNGYRYDDATDLPAGRIHVSHNRVGQTQKFSAMQMSYPSFISDYALRDVYVATLVCDMNANAQDRRWVAYAVALRRREGQTWPERGIGSSTDARRLAPQGLNSPAGTTDGGGNDHPNKGWPNEWGYWNSYCVTGETKDVRLPGLFNLPMIVYDWKSNLIEVAYPPVYVPGGPAGSVDRRLTTGDKFITREGGIIFTVLSTRDVGTDKSYQIVEVYPPISTTLLGPNSGGKECDPNWRLREGFFSPRPAEGGPSPLTRIEVIPAARGFTENSNH